MIRQYELVERVRLYNPNTNEVFLNKAYVFAMRAHGSQKRASGDPYFSHPIEVAAILTNLRLDDTAIVTALLHDTIEDTDISRADIEREFGSDVANLVDGVTKLTKLELQEIPYEEGKDSSNDERIQQAENFRKLLVAVSSDIRVLLVKLADRLHNMRTLHYIEREEKRMRIARETLELYAPLAGRIGIQDMREELEELSFAQLHSDMYHSIVTRLERLKLDSSNLLKDIENEITQKLLEHNTQAKVKGRIKSAYSIYEKMHKQALNFEQLSDVIGFRVMVNDNSDCYKALGIIHQCWNCVPGRFKDYISMPKRNGYKSIHTMIMMGAKKVEIQIRTDEMHRIAEQGVAAHWQYKSGIPLEPERYAWVRELIEAVKDGGTAVDLLEHTKQEIYHDQVFCFTPKGKIIRLPRGATPVDFAYMVHSTIGNTCMGAKINGIRIPLRSQIQNGDVVEILCTPLQTPSPAWEGFVVTGRAKTAIRRFAKLKEKEQYIRLGQTILERAMSHHELEMTDKLIDMIKNTFHLKTNDDMYISLAKGKLLPNQIIKTMFPDLDKNIQKVASDNIQKEKSDQIPINGLLPGMAIHLGKCCFPLPGDNIVGIMKEGIGIEVHSVDCNILTDYEDQSHLWIDLKWDSEQKQFSMPYSTKIHVEMMHEPGSLGNVCTLIGRNDGNITNISMVERRADYFIFEFDLEVRNTKHLQNILNALNATQQVTNATRVRFEQNQNIEKVASF